jgi:hypothetical protein
MQFRISLTLLLPSEQALLVNVGDFIHANGSSGTTFAGTKLDVDTRIESSTRNSSADVYLRY